MSAFAQISGRLGLDPELRRTSGGTAVVNLSVANNRTMRVGDVREPIADWYKVTVYGRDAETIVRYARKGSALSFNGRLQIESFLDRDGNRRAMTVIVADRFEFVPPARREDHVRDEAGAPIVKVGLTASDEDDPIPF
jgi:single-strand DNA-binding protein